MTEEKNMVWTCVRIPEELWKWLKIKSAEERIPMYQLVMEIVEEARRKEAEKKV